MKNRVLAAGIGVVALAIAACSPPGEVDSDKFVDTATGVAKPTVTSTAAASSDSKETTTSTAATSTAAADSDLPGYINCVGTPEQRPDEISLACGDNNDVLRDIKWTDWTATSAAGTATRVTNDCLPNCADGKTVNKPGVKVVLSNPFETVNGASFTQVAIDGVVVLP
ncbi:hypothetical protein [Corynebacterium aquilae]|uniref:Secreted protein n=1 Tax=Corynebacterium aquilae DSM 44791 TaxID=1431546 RepID=A0A1L7CEX5_9CORY|nr:hypothetical protein [Corynebacterium aquilae]APT84430.1 hypothetical protein CAQU_04390 [Corynebacterium aquilae DSM 44791]